MRGRERIRRFKRRARRVVRLQKTYAYYGGCCIVLALFFLVVGLSFSQYGAVQYAPALAPELHESSRFVVHERDGGHHHTVLGNLAFGKNEVYIRCDGNVVIDGVLHVDGKHVDNVRKYGDDYINAIKGEKKC